MGESPHSHTPGRRVVIIGSGNVAWHLSPAIAASHNLLGIYSRSSSSAHALACHVQELCGTLPVAGTLGDGTILPAADIYVYAVGDDALPIAAAAAYKSANPDAIHVHTSGSAPANIFTPYVAKYGVLYPLQTFSKQDTNIQLSEVPFLIEGNTSEVTAEILDFAGTLSAKVLEADSKKRREIHIAAVFACNFANSLWGIAHNRLQQAGIDFSILFPLLQKTLHKISIMTPAEAQTGPAARNDTSTIESHISSLQGEEKEIYELLTHHIIASRNRLNTNK